MLELISKLPLSCPWSARIAAFLAILLLHACPHAAADDVQTFTIEAWNDDEFATAPPPPPVHEVEQWFDVASTPHTQTIPNISRNLRNLSVRIVNTGNGLVRQPYLFGPRNWDFRSLEAIAREATRTPGLSQEEKFIRVHEWKGLHVMTVLGTSYDPYNDLDFSGNPSRVLNQYGHGMCGESTNTTNALLLATPPLGSMYGRKIKLNGHRVGEAYFDGRWHAFDTTPGTGVIQWIYYDANNLAIAPSWKDLVTRPELVARARELCGFSAERYLAGSTAEPVAEKRVYRQWDFSYDLRPGEDVTMYFDMRGRLDRTSARQDNSKSYRCYSDYASAVFTYRPNLTDARYATYTSEQANVVPTAGGLVPRNPAQPSHVIFPIHSTWCFAGADITARFKTTGRIFIAVNSDPLDLELANQPAWQLLSTAQQEYPGASIEGKMAYWVKVEFQGAGSGLSELAIASEVQMNPWSMPALEYGINRLRVEAKDLGGSSLRVTYRYDDRSPYHFYQPATGSRGRHIPLRIGGVLQQGSEKAVMDFRKGRFWYRLAQTPNETVATRVEIFQVSGASAGRRVRTLIDVPLRYGFYKFYWDGTDDSRRSLPSGMYAYRLSIQGKLIHGERLYLYDEIWPFPSELQTRSGLEITAPARATPDAALLGQLIHFSVQARTSDGLEPAYSWDFGDGRKGSGPSPLHAYSRAGVYLANVSVVDAEGRIAHSEVKVTVRPPFSPTAPARLAQGGGGGLEWNALFPAEAPSAAALDETTPQSLPPAFVADEPVVETFTVTRLMGRVRLRGEREAGQFGPDTCTLAGLLPPLPADWTPRDKLLTVHVGGVETHFVLDQYGRGKNALGRIVLNFGRRGREHPDGPITFRLRLKGDLANEWLDEGVYTDADEIGTVIPFELGIDLDGNRSAVRIETTLSVQAGRGAVFRS